MRTTFKFIFFTLLGACSPLWSTTPDDTVIVADRCEMDTGTRTFHFSGHVKVQSKDFIVNCDELQVLSEAKENEAGPTSAAHTPTVGPMEKITAWGHVEVIQGERQATAGRAEVFSKENRIVLSESPIVIDAKGKVEGFRIILFHDKEGVQRVMVEGDPSSPGERPRIILPSMSEIGKADNKPADAASNPNSPAESEPPQAQPDSSTLPEPIGVSEPADTTQTSPSTAP